MKVFIGNNDVNASLAFRFLIISHDVIFSSLI